MQFELIKDKPSIIKVIGVGGGGSNAVNHMYRQGIKGVEFLVCNTDAQALEISPVPTKIQLGPSLTEGRGAGSIPEVGKKAAIENVDEIKALLANNTKMVFVTAGMGGGTGTGAAPIIAGIAKEMGILTVGIVTVPFSHEGRKRKQQAELGIEELKKNVDALLIICNDKLREIHGNLQLGKAFAHADDILTIAAKSIAEIITVTMLVNVDFADIETVMKDSGVAIMGAATAEGEQRARIAAEMAIDSPLLNDNHIEGARYILLNITSGEREVTMDEVGEITEHIQEQAGQTADIIMGIGTDPTLGEKIGVTIIATGFKTNSEVGIEQNKKPERIVHMLTSETSKIIIDEVVVEQKQVIKEEIVINPLEPVLIIREPKVEEKREETIVLTNKQTIEPIINFSINEVVTFKEEPLIVNEEIVVTETIIEEALTVNTTEETIESVVEITESVIETSEPINIEMQTPEMETPVAESKPVEQKQEERPIEINLNINTEAPIATPRPIVIALEERMPAAKPQEQKMLTPEEELFRTTRERLMKIRETNFKLNSPNGILDLEKEPAYKRRNVQLDSVPASSDSSVSRYTLTTDDKDRKPEIRPNNSFLHDKVD